MGVMIGYVHGGMVHEGFASSLSDCIVYDKSKMGRNEIWGRCAVRGLYVADSRNEVCKRFLAAEAPQGKPEWLFFLDTDISFSPAQFYAVLDSAHAKERPIVGGLYFGFSNGSPTPVWRMVHTEGPLAGSFGLLDKFTTGTVEPVTAVGMGFTVIHRSVLEAMADVYRNDNWTWFGHDLWKDQRMGEDLTFCYRALQLGFTTFGNSKVVLDHEKTVQVNMDTFAGALAIAEAQRGKQNEATRT